MRHYLLTGATGVVGSETLRSLLMHPHDTVSVLIRADDDAHLKKRVATLLDFLGLSDDPAKHARIEALRGDAASPRFGLSSDDYSRLADHCTHIIHSAGAVRMNLPLIKARRSAVDSVREVLVLSREMNRRGTLGKVEVISTVGVAGKTPGAVRERWLHDGREFHNSYEQSKSEAEQLIRAAIDDERMPITVHRPSMVVGNASSGQIVHFQIFYYICEFLSGRRTFGLYPEFGDVRLDIVPADTVADAIVAASHDATTAGRIFHLASGPALAPPLAELKSIVRAAFAARGVPTHRDITVPRGLYGKLVRAAAAVAPPSQRKALATLPIFLEHLFDQTFDNASFRSWMASRNRSLPVFTDYIDEVLGYYLDRRPVESRR